MCTIYIEYFVLLYTIYILELKQNMKSKNGACTKELFTYHQIHSHTYTSFHNTESNQHCLLNKIMLY